MENLPNECEKTSNNTGKGVLVTLDYSPVELKLGITPDLRKKLLVIVKEAKNQIEEIGREVLDLGGPIW